MTINKKKLICLDYDGSYTEFPELFQLIINRAKDLNYEVILATMRYEHEIDDELKKLQNQIKIYFTGRKAKINYLTNLGIFPDLFIDDLPEFLFQNAR